MTQVGIASIARLIVPALQVAFGHDPKRADGSDRAAVVAVQLVPLFAIEHHLALESAGQLNAVEEYVTRIDVSVATVTITVTITEIAWIVRVAVESRRAIQFNPPRLDVAVVIVTIAWIEVQQSSPHSKPLARIAL